MSIWRRRGVKAFFISFRHFVVALSGFATMSPKRVWRRPHRENRLSSLGSLSRGKTSTHTPVLYELSTNCSYAIVLFGYGPRERVPETILETIDAPFESGVFSIPKNYDLILTAQYGDYMTPPPPEKRISHGFKAFWKDHE